MFLPNLLFLNLLFLREVRVLAKLPNFEFSYRNVKKGSYLWALGANGSNHEGWDHRRYKNENLITHTHLMTWPPLTRRFLVSRATFITLHVHCYSKKPRRLIKAKVELSPFFWKHSPRGVVRVTYLRQFKSDFRFEKLEHACRQVSDRYLTKISIKNFKLIEKTILRLIWKHLFSPFLVSLKIIFSINLQFLKLILMRYRSETCRHACSNFQI